MYRKFFQDKKREHDFIFTICQSIAIKIDLFPLSLCLEIPPLPGIVQFPLGESKKEAIILIYGPVEEESKPRLTQTDWDVWSSNWIGRVVSQRKKKKKKKNTENIREMRVERILKFRSKPGDLFCLSFFPIKIMNWRRSRKGKAALSLSEHFFPRWLRSTNKRWFFPQ